MKEYYKIMEDILEVEYRIRATVYVLDELEKSYSEETNFKEKYLLSVFKGALVRFRVMCEKQSIT